jgi:protein SCO1/2
MRRFFLGAGLPVFLLAAVTVYEAFLLALVFAPEGAGWWGSFAREFRVWCFSYDPRTGGMAWSSVGMMVLEPLFVVAVAVVLWRQVIGTLRSPRALFAHWRSAIAGVAASVVAAVTLLAYAGPRVEEALPPFPGERIRTQLVPPAFRLVDQSGRECSLEDLRGRIVLMTGIYATCSTSCPQILIETRKLIESLPAEARAQLSVVALSLNPEYETTELMAALAAAYGFTYPEFRYLNGKPALMHDVLAQLQFARVRNSATGVIDHANLFIVLDARGTIAYRFNLNPRHQAWLREAIVALTAEAAEFERIRVAGL